MDLKSNFDIIIDRTGTNSLKQENLQKVFGTKDLIPMWVADMDFPAPDFIIDAIRKRCDTKILGYTIIPDSWRESICSWLKKRHYWNVEKYETGFLPGLVSGIGLAIQCFTEPGDKVLVEAPVYTPFLNVPVMNGRELVVSQLVYENNIYKVDFDDFEKKVASGCKMFILCNPHNPSGRVWTKDELKKMAEICIRHNVLIVSDEIHSDLIMPGYKHCPAASISPEIAGHVITMMAPSKTFNIAGLSSSFYVIHNQEIRNKFKKYLDSAELSDGNIFAIIAAQAAYENGEEWLESLNSYLYRNIEYVDNYLKENIPEITACSTQATYLMWLDCQKLNLPEEELEKFFVKDAKLGLNKGTIYGPGGEGFMRMNIGCPFETVKKAMEQLNTAVKALRH